MVPATHVFVDDLARRRAVRRGPPPPRAGAAAAPRRGGHARPTAGAAGAGSASPAPAGSSPTDRVEHRPAPAPAITVGFALTKGERPEWTVQKLTEVGVDRIVPFVAARTVVRWDGEKGARQVGRLRAVARSAAMQSRRDRLPVVHDVVAFEAAVAAGRAGGRRWPTPAGGRRASTGRPCWSAPRADSPTRSWPRRCPGRPMGLGPRILRAETAAMAAGVLLCALRANVVGPARTWTFADS